MAESHTVRTGGGRRGRSGVGGPKVFAGCLTLATGMCLHFIKLLRGAPNRQVYLWTRMDTVALFLDIAVAAGILAGLFFLLRRWLGAERLGRALEWLFPAAFVAVGLQANPLPRSWNAAWGAGLAAVAVALWAGMFFPRFRRLGLPGKILVFFSPLYAVMFAGLLGFPDLPPPPDGGEPGAPAAPAGDGAAGAPVWVVISDAVGYGDCTEADGAWKPVLTNLAAMADRSVSFSRAFSGGIETFPSMPNFVFQDRMVPGQDDLDEGRDWTDACLAWRGRPAGGDLFGMAEAAGYATGFATSYLPWSRILPTTPRRLWGSPFDRFVRSETFPARMVNAAAGAVLHLQGLDLVSKRLVVAIRERYARNRALYALEALGRMRAMAAEMPPRMFVVAHTQATHDNVFLPDGSISENTSVLDELRFADARWGEIAGILRGRGLYDSAWIVFTSDHDHEHAGRHVPLLVKPPGGLPGPVRADREVHTWEMRGFFQCVFGGGTVAECLAQLGVSAGRHGEGGENGGGAPE